MPPVLPPPAAALPASPAGSSTAPTPGEPYTVAIQYRALGQMAELPLTTDDTTFYPFVQRWRYVVANRRRITASTRERLSGDLSALMREVCKLDALDFESRVRAMAAAGTVQVRIPFERESQGWAARLFPWESALSLLTLAYREDDARFTVLRHLAVTQPLAPSRAPPDSLLVVRSAPTPIERVYDLAGECDMVRRALARAIPATGPLLTEPDRAALQARIVADQPAIVHLAGIDRAALLQMHGDAASQPPGEARTAPTSQTTDAENGDSFVLRQSAPGHDSVPPGALAALVTSAARKPWLVALSSCFSAPRIGALCVAQGAEHAIAFQDTLTDADAMLFFGHLYGTWARTHDLPGAFAEARRKWATQTGLTGTGVVLWSGRSMLQAEPAAPTWPAAAPPLQPAPKRRRGAAAGAAPAAGAGTADVPVPSQLPPQVPLRVPPPAALVAPVPEPIDPSCLSLNVAMVADRMPDSLRSSRAPTSTSLNYSLLHNDRTPFASFIVDKPLCGHLPPVEVLVVLEVGGDTCRCRFSVVLPYDAGPVELKDKIRLPLVAGLLRYCTESLRTNLYVHVKCDDLVLRESSERVTILPADEWRDDGEDHRWLPCFVLPRDPAVLKVIDAAQRYLRTLLDDCSAGFDGYQQLADDDHNAADVVDAQVQAIWAAIQHDLPINYINPPPSYTSRSQRLRSPSEIFRGNAATCIDLALLFASCLEFVGIYPVVFLITGHAFPGYWRSDKAWWRMSNFEQSEGDTGPTAATAAEPLATTGQTERWLFDEPMNLGELLGYVQQGTLVPFETTFVTARRGFFASLEQGAAQLHPQSFDAMIDIQSARAARVTPLPLFDKFG